MLFVKIIRSKIKSSFLRRILGVAFVVSGIFLMLVVITSLLFFVYKDDISRKIILHVNTMQSGDLSFNKIALKPFAHFPNIALNMTDLVYLGPSHVDSTEVRDTIAQVGMLDIVLDVVDLIRGEVNVSKLAVAEGRVYLKMNPDTTLNIQDALVQPDAKSAAPQTLPDDPDTRDVPEAISIVLNGVSVENMELHYTGLDQSKTAHLEIESILASLSHIGDSVELNVELSANLSSLVLMDTHSLRNVAIDIGYHLIYEKERRTLIILPSRMNVNRANFALDGTIDLEDGPMLDMRLKGADEDLSFFSIWLTDLGLQNLRSGETYFDGSIQGSMEENKMPEMKFLFGMRNLDLHIPEVNRSISELNFHGSFLSGTARDFSQARLRLDTLTGRLPGGFIHANLLMTDFKSPTIAAALNLQADIAGFDDIFEVGEIERLSGRLKVSNELKLVYDPMTEKFIERINTSDIRMDSIAFTLPGLMTIKDMTGSLKVGMDSLEIQELGFMAGESDLWLEGVVRNWSAALNVSEGQLLANLHIVSDTFDLPDFLSFEPRVRERFPHRITGVNLKTQATTTSGQLLNFTSNPEIHFDIQHLDATVEHMFSPVEISEGQFLLAEKEERIFLNFTGFDLEIGGGRIQADVIYHSPADEPDRIEVRTNVTELNPSRVFYFPSDSVPTFLLAFLNGGINIELETGLDTLVFERVDLHLPKLTYSSLKDTFDLHELRLSGHEINYKGGSNPLSSLSASAKLQASKVHSNHFEVNDVSYTIEVSNGVFTIVPDQVWFFGKEGEGVYSISPFSDPPRYQVQYRVENFQAEAFLSAFLADTLLQGPMALELDVVLENVDKNNLLAGMNGVISLRGQDLTLNGVDLDVLIRKYQRSQNFNLVDLGAVALAGPFGLAISKGSQFANLALGNYGQTTHIQELVSEWTCENGKLIIRDVAFSTDENRLALSGLIDLPADTLQLSAALLDKNGCRILKQSVTGSVGDPSYSELKILGTLIGPLTNLIDGALGNDCEDFYTGKIQHPAKK